MGVLSDIGLVSELGFIFDLDGVIVDSNPIHSAVWRVYLARHGVVAAEDFDQKMFGRRNDEIVREVFGAGLDPAEVSRHGAAKEVLYRQVMGPVLREHLVPGLVPFLERHRNVPAGVATNAEPANADFVLESGGVGQYFRVVVDGGQVSQPKPDPEIYLRTAELLQLPPANCIVFEDSRAGAEAARAAGARVVALRTTHDQLPNVDLSIRDYLDPELEPWLSEQRPVG
ncbi:MAG: HAD family phosphatase [Bryobacteraceae bacterium]|jgi:HAD superfamily hydrolase (TIGR01509 family)